jgi:hypothetical protein
MISHLLTFISRHPIFVWVNLMDFVDRFPDQEACVAHLETVRWPKGPACPKCGVIGNALRLRVPPAAAVLAPRAPIRHRSSPGGGP